MSCEFPTQYENTALQVIDSTSIIAQSKPHGDPGPGCTGCLHTMYVDKPMQRHGLMQAIARVNRVFKDKPGGLVVDYLGLADQLKRALATYTESGGTGKTAIDQGEAVAVMQEKHEICCGIFHGFDWSGWAAASPLERLRFLPAAQEHVLAQEDG